MTSFVLSSKAKADLEAITDHLLENASVDVALKMLEGLENAADRVGRTPELGHLRQDLASEPLRFWLAKPYLIIYRPDASPVEIVRILHASRDISEILSD